uniref:Thioredoxin domain-containing protein n=3 Tax=Hemiselmis andersenii TaxID=464988 RepID=A0A7S1DJY6_HEMAN|mmetsp:Transcript_15900/g.38495  ORF Transcript_15900/g.38495 Transcript_15900/m.38495 type:complete len:246 (+) Transcript_15900:335-1072(+)
MEERDPIWAWKPRTIFTQLNADNSIDSQQLIHRGPGAMKALYHWSNRVVLVYFKKEGCSICRVFQPILERVVKEYEHTESVHYVDVDVLQNPIITKTAGLTSVPAMCIYKDGVLIEQIKGAHCKKFMRKAFDTIVSSKGATAGARLWAQERLRTAQMDDYVRSKPYKTMIKAHEEHPQQFPPAWRMSHSPALGGLRRKRFGACGQVVRALFDEGEHHEVTRKLLPAFHSLPGHKSSDRLVVQPNP